MHAEIVMCKEEQTGMSPTFTLKFNRQDLI